MERDNPLLSVSEAVRCLRAGEVIAYPTEAVYGLGCDPLDAHAVLRLLALKDRPMEKGLILIASDFQQLQPFIRTPDSATLEKIQSTWPGPVTWLLPVKPAVILMDEPCSALDPEATMAVEELIWGLRGQYTILLVTHNMAQARRASDECAFMLLGKMIEHRKTEELFVTPEHKETADYIEGRYG